MSGSGMSGFFPQHYAAQKSAVRRLLSSPLNTLLSLVVIGAALALPAAGWVMLDKLQGFAGQVSGVQQISVFMATDAGKEEAAEIESRLRQANPGQWRFVAREEALKSLEETEGMADVAAGLAKNPLPDAFVVEAGDRGPETLEKLAETFKSWPAVAHVQLDSAWSRRLDAFLRIGALAVSLLAALFAGALVAVTFNTIRLQILAQAAEIEVSRLIGATDAFIRRPFQYFGALQGALGGLFALSLVAGIGLALAAPARELLALYGVAFTPGGPTLPQAAAIVGVGAALGWLGAQISVSIYLRRVG
ncbi:MAG: permease-like cell division protein FtsX [Candidatus Accumulibacter sp.]|jgi:cell division transport system permease protein|nr:permease-like cell division protein FtsX [Accumulibacter sp.]